VAVLAGIIASALLVWHASYAAFSATTSNAGNSWKAGTVHLSDDAAGTALFSTASANMKPGDTVVNCITVSYTGSLAAAVKLYGSVTAGSPDLGPALSLTVEQVTPAAGGCSSLTATNTVFNGTLEGGTKPFTAYTNYGNGLATTFAPTAASATPQTAMFRFTVTLASTADNSLQGGSAQAAFTWEAQNT
jgi:hypothetical protein